MAFSTAQTSKRGRITSTMASGSTTWEKDMATVTTITRIYTLVSGSKISGTGSARYLRGSRIGTRASGRMTWGMAVARSPQPITLFTLANSTRTRSTGRERCSRARTRNCILSSGSTVCWWAECRRKRSRTRTISRCAATPEQPWWTGLWSILCDLEDRCLETRVRSWTLNSREQTTTKVLEARVPIKSTLWSKKSLR